MMGMDVSGKNPTTQEGEYFRASCWGWRPIHFLMTIANAEHGNTIMSEKMMTSMQYNDGAGLQTQKECDYLATALEEILNNVGVIEKYGSDIIYVDKKDGDPFFTFPVEESMAVTMNGQFVPEGKEPIENLCSPWKISVSRLRAFVEFLRGCGGFEVW